MRALAGVLAALILGIALGLGSACFAVDRFALSGAVTVGGWKGNLLTGSAEADPYTRAAVAKTALLALARTETVYFMRSEDDSGAPLNPACSYEMRATTDPAARWWSVTLYDESFFLARNEDAAASIDATRVAREAGGGWRVVIGPTPKGFVNWLSTNATQRFTLTIRLYNPDPAIVADPGKAVLPSVSKLSCPEAGA